MLNPSCALHLEDSDPIFSHDTMAYDDVPSNQVWLQKDQQFRGYSISHILILLSLNVTLTLKLVNQSLCMSLHIVMIH